jgi:hypothetical protein
MAACTWATEAAITIAEACYAGMTELLKLQEFCGHCCGKAGVKCVICGHRKNTQSNIEMLDCTPFANGTVT